MIISIIERFLLWFSLSVYRYVTKNISEFFECNVGVRQGDNLSPLLFAMYINDFESYVKKEYDGLTLLNTEIDRLLGDNLLDLYLK